MLKGGDLVKMNILQSRISGWMTKEQQYTLKLKESHKLREQHTLLAQNIQYFATSSPTMQGLQDRQEFLFSKARMCNLVLPKAWCKMYFEIADRKYAGDRFLNIDTVRSIFKKVVPLRKWLSSGQNKFHSCLQLLHDTGILLWYKENEKLTNVVFHNMPFIIASLQALFRHNLCTKLLYDHEKHRRYISTQTKFVEEVQAFIYTGMLSVNILKCIWEEISLCNFIIDTMVHMLTNMDLCYPK